MYFVYDGKGLRARSQKNGVNTYEFYTLDGKLMGVYSATGALLKEYVYLYDKQVALVVDSSLVPISGADDVLLAPAERLALAPSGEPPGVEVGNRLPVRRVAPSDQLGVPLPYRRVEPEQANVAASPRTGS